MKTKRVKELESEIRSLESQREYLTSIIGLHIAEANMIDMQIEVYTKAGIAVEHKLRDLRAELKDTI